MTWHNDQSSIYDLFLSTAQEMEDILQMFDDNVKGVYGNHTCISLQTSIDEEDENLTSHHHRHLRKFIGA